MGKNSTHFFFESNMLLDLKVGNQIPYVFPSPGHMSIVRVGVNLWTRSHKLILKFIRYPSSSFILLLCHVQRSTHLSQAQYDSVPLIRMIGKT
jgi:hypothetical protein